MTKRVLAFLMVIAMVFSLIPTVVVAEEAEAPAAFEVIIQRAHNQTSAEGVDVDIYLQAAAAAEVTAFQVTFDKVLNVVATKDGVQGTAVNVDAEGNEIPADDTETEVAGTATKLVYPPADTAAEENPPIAVEAGRTLLATVNAATLAEVAISYVEVTVEGGYYANVAGTAEDGYLGEAAVEALPYACDGHDCGHGEGTWVEFTATAGELTAGNYYLTSDVQLTGALDVAADAEVTICLNGFDITAADGMYIFELTKAGSVLNICDCTAEGEGAAYTAGKLLPKRNQGGALRSIDAENTINFYGGVIDGTNSTKKEASVALAVGSTLNMLGGKVENFDAGLLSSGNHYGPIIVRGKADGADGVATIADVTFVNCGSGIISGAPGGSDRSDGAVLTVEDVTVLDSASGAYAVEIKNRFKSVTLKGDCKFDVPVYVAAGEELTLALDATADVNIATESELDEVGFNQLVKMADGGELTTGTVIYETVGVFVAYDEEAKLFTFVEGHKVDGAVDENGSPIVFSVWDKTDSLPTEGNWYLNQDVEVTMPADATDSDDAAVTISRGKTLNLDLHGHDIKSKDGRSRLLRIEGTLNLYDCMDGYDADGNWTGGELTGCTADYGAIKIIRSDAGKDNGGVFNMYGGRISGNGGGQVGQKNGGAIYIYGTASASLHNGGTFNMYGGEITNNTVGYAGSAITTYCSSNLGEGYHGAVINLEGGKIYGNTCLRTDEASKDGIGTIRAIGVTVVNISKDAEISGNTARVGGAVYAADSATVNITGGVIKDNTTSSHGSAIAMTGTTTLNMNKEVLDDGTEVVGQIIDNTATGGGGAIYLEGSAELNASACKVNSNTSYYGGALFVKGSTTKANVTGGQWNENEATVSWSGGGALYADGASTISFANAEMKGNSAPTGGAIRHNSSGTVTLKNCILSGNSSTSSDGSAIYLNSSAKVNLNGTVITGNTASSGKGAIYMKTATSELRLSGATVVAGNLNKSGASASTTDVYFADQTTRETYIQVNELTDGAHVNVYNDNATPLEATTLVKVQTDKTQTDWSCGWITYFYKDAATSESVAYRDLTPDDEDDTKTFTYGHWHGDVKYDPVDDALPTTAGNYYLTKDVTITSSWVPATGTTLCFNGKVVTSKASAAVALGASEAKTVTFQDCTGAEAADGRYIGGGITNTNTGSYNGRALHFGDASATVGHTVNWEGGKIFGCTSSNSGDAERTVAIYMQRSNATYKCTLNFSGGAVCGNTNQDASADVTAKTKRAIIKVQSCVLNITGGKFYDNKGLTSTTGAAYGLIYYVSGTLNISGAEFFNNHAATGAGVVYISNAGTVGTIENCVFKDNTTDGNGAAIYNGKTITLKDCTFEGNEAGGNGGAIYHTANTLNLVNCVFDGNTANNGGAIALKTSRSTSSTSAVNATVNIKNGCQFINNEATTNGGVIYSELVATSGGTNTIRHNVYITNEDKTQYDNCLFENNKAGVEGGVISASSGGTNCYFYINISDATFRNNSANTEKSTGLGGVACLRGNTYMDTCNNSLFEGNKAYDSGVFHQQGSSTRVQDATGCQFINNSATSAGGVSRMNWFNATNPTQYLSCQFTGNTAAHGGAFYVEGGNGQTLKFGSIDENGAVSNGCTFTGNKATSAEGKGGAIYATNPHSTSGVPHSPKIYIYDTTFTENEAYSGGAIYATAQTADADQDGEPDYPYNSDVTIDGCYFTKNKATSNAAAVAVYARAVVRMKDTTVQNNVDKVRGAVYVATNNASLTLSGRMNITNNTGETFPNADLVFQHSADGAEYDPVVDVSGLTAGSLIGINATDGRYERTPVLGSAAPAEPTGSEDYTAFSDYFFSNDESRFVTYVTDTGDLILTKYVTEDGYFDSVQDAIENAATSGEEFTLQAGTTETVEIPDGITSVNLNGATVSEIVVPADKELVLKDTTSDFNTPAEEIVKVKVSGEGTVKSEFESDGKRYMVVTDDEGYASVHRVHLVLSHRLLRPATFGAGFKANFYADEVLSEKVTYGVIFSFNAGAKPSDFENSSTTSWMAADFDVMQPGYESGVKPNQKVLAVTNLLTDNEETNNWNVDLWGVPFVNVGGTITHEEIGGKMYSHISGGTTIYGTPQYVNMKTLAQNAYANGGDMAQKVADMLEAKGLDTSALN